MWSWEEFLVYPDDLNEAVEEYLSKWNWDKYGIYKV